MLTVQPSPYAKFSASLLAETLVENRRHDLEEVLARYLQFHGMTEDYQLRDDLLWGVASVADFVGVTPKRMFGWVENGRFPHCRPGGTASVSARKSVIHCYLFAQELASLKGISLKEYASSVAGDGASDHDCKQLADTANCGT